MTNNIIYALSGLLAVSLIAGCSQNAPPGNSALNSSASTGTGATAFDDPCLIIMMPSAVNEGDMESSVDKTITHYQKAASTASNPLSRLERLGWAFVEKARESRDAGYYKMAEQAALCIENQMPDSAEALLLRGHVLHNLHHFREAEKLARHLVELRGLWFDFALLGDVLIERGALNEAIDAYQRVIDQRPGPQAYVRVAQLRWLKGDLDGALEMMSLAVRSTSPRTPEAAAWAHVRLATFMMQADEFPAADAVLTRALSLKPEYPPALHARGHLLLAQGHNQAAVLLLNQAVQADPLPQFRWALYEALQETGQHMAAAEQAAALLQYGAVDDRRTFALFLATMGDKPDTALRLSLQELEEREDVFTLDAVAWSLSAAGQIDAALDYSRRALAEGTQDARLYLHAGVIAVRAGDSGRAHELLSKSRTTQYMLLPSERRQLAKEFAALQSQYPALVEEQGARQDQSSSM